jgi:hypothetical protein
MRGAIALCVVAVVAIGAAACGSSSSPAASSLATAGSGLHLPAQLLGLSKNTGSDTQVMVRKVTSALATLSALRGPQVAVYGDFSGPFFLMFAARLSRASASASYDKGFVEGFAKASGITGLQSFPAGSHGGVLDCGHQTSNGATAITCIWADQTTAGAVTYYKGSASGLNDAASKTNQVRAAVGS